MWCHSKQGIHFFKLFSFWRLQLHHFSFPFYPLEPPMYPYLLIFSNLQLLFPANCCCTHVSAQCTHACYLHSRAHSRLDYCSQILKSVQAQLGGKLFHAGAVFSQIENVVCQQYMVLFKSRDTWVQRTKQEIRRKLCHSYFTSKLVNILYCILQLGSTHLEDSKECFIKGHGNSLLNLEIDTAT